MQRSVCAYLATALCCVTGLIAGPAMAQHDGSRPSQLPWSAGIEISVTPYLWLPWSSTSVRPSNTQIPGASSTIGPYDLISHLTWVPFMGAFEVRSGDFAFVGDYFHAPLKSGVSTRGILFQGGSDTTTIDSGTALFLYRPISLPDQSLDIGLGVRVWGIDGTIALDRRIAAPTIVSTGGAFADPLIAARYRRDLGNGFSATAYGDIGGFGLGAHVDWQLLATIDYAYSQSTTLKVGFRSLNFSIGTNSANFNVNMYGPVLGATIRF